MAKTKRVWLRHDTAFEAYSAYVERLSRERPGANPNSFLYAKGLQTSHLQRIFARRGGQFSEPFDAGQISRTTLELFVELVAPERAVDEFIDVDKAQVKKEHKAASAADHTSSPWTPGVPTYLRDDLAKLYVAPQEGGARFPLDVSVGLSSIYVKIPAGDDTPALSATVRVDAGEVLPRSGSLQPVEGTILGKDKRAKNVAYDGVRWNFVNPRMENFHPLSEARLCEMRVVGAGPHVLELQLRCREIDFGVEIHSSPPDLDSKKEAILRRLLQKLGTADPDAEYVDLARVEMRREEKT